MSDPLSEACPASALTLAALTRHSIRPLLVLGALLVLATSIGVGQLLDARVKAAATMRATTLLEQLAREGGVLPAAIDPDLRMAVLSGDRSRVLRANDATLLQADPANLATRGGEVVDGAGLVMVRDFVATDGSPGLLWLRVDLSAPLREVQILQLGVMLAGILGVVGFAAGALHRLRRTLQPGLQALEAALGGAAVSTLPEDDAFRTLVERADGQRSALALAERRAQDLERELTRRARWRAEVFEQAPFAGIHCTHDGTVIALNAMARQLFALDSDARPTLASLLPSVRPADALRGVATHACRRAETLAVRVHAQALGGDLADWLLVVFDDTARQRAIAESDASTLRLRRVLDAAHDGVWVLDRDLRGLEANATLAGLFDLRPVELAGRRASEFVDGDGAAFEALLRAAVSGVATAPCEVAFRRADGSRCWGLVTVSALAEQSSAALLLTVADLTALKRTEEALRDSEQRLAMAAANGGLTAWEYEGASARLCLDPRFAALLAGEGPLHASGLDAFLGRCDPVDATVLAQALEDVAAGRCELLDVECRVQDAQGTWRWLRMQGQVAGQGATAQRVCGILREVTTERTALAALASARDDAVRAARVKSLFLANMSHELRTPLNGVLGMLSLLEHEPLNDEQREFVDVAVKSGRVLFDLINDVLDFSKIEAGALQIERVECDLRALAEDVVAMLAENAHQRGLDIVLHWDPGLPRHIECDPARLRQVLLNLLGNAVKFTDRGHVMLRLRPDPGAGSIVFDVTDTGIGIAPEQHARIFEAFKQGDETMTRRYGGTGLGLSITRQLVELMGGRLALDSAPGAGSRFWFDLPVPAARFEPHDTAGGALAGRRILLHEDSRVVRDAAAALLRAHGAQVDCVATLPELAALLREPTSCDLVILAVGPELQERARDIEALRALPGCGTLPVLGTLAFGRRSGTEEQRSLGVQGLLTKPLRETSLLRAIDEVLAPDNLEALAATLPRPVVTPGTERRALAALEVLVVDDVATNLKVAAGMLGRLGIRATLAESGRAALEAIANTEFALVFMDCQMPGMDGFETTARIRARYAPGAGPRIVAMTANAASTDRDRCLASGMDDYLAKPVLLSDLERVLHRWISAPAPARPASPRQAGSPVDGVDQRKIEELASLLGAEEFDALCERFVRDGRAQLTAFESALARRDDAAARRAAHALKGAAANVGAVGLSQLCQAVEMQSSVEMHAALRPLTDALAHFCGALEAQAAAA